MKLPLRKVIGYAIIGVCFSSFMSAIATARDQGNFCHVLMITTAWIWALGLGIALMTWREL